jgi:Beta-lactamase
VTVRDLLNPTSGLPSYAATPEYSDAVAASPHRSWDLEQIVRVALSAPGSQPGHFHHSNLGYWLLGAGLTESGYDIRWAGPPWRESAYGLGLMIDRGLGTFGHGGEGPGHTSAALIIPADNRSRR